LHRHGRDPIPFRLGLTGGTPATMTISRSLALAIHFVLDECVPPILRDRAWFTWLPFRLLFGRHADTFRSFKDRAHALSPEEFRRVYEETAGVHLHRPTDLNRACLARVLERAAGRSVLEVGCGRGHLAGLLARAHEVTACDLAIDASLPERHPRITFREENVERLSFADRSFDTVICTHTLEHVQDLDRAVRELRRVARRRLIVVVPRQRPYRHTFDLHLHFFPLGHLLVARFPAEPAAGRRELTSLGGDWFYEEDRIEPARPAVKSA
jgi:SAM-dependent methyltransferase